MANIELPNIEWTDFEKAILMEMYPRVLTDTRPISWTQACQQMNSKVRQLEIEPLRCFEPGSVSAFMSLYYNTLVSEWCIDGEKARRYLSVIDVMLELRYGLL